MYQKLNGLVLKSKVSKEADKTVTLYTDCWGKINAVVPGAKRIKAKLAAASEPIVESEFVAYMSNPNSRPRITGAKISNSFHKLKKSWYKAFIADYCSELVDALTPVKAENIKKYALIKRTWHLIEVAENPWRIASAFALRFLELSGYSFTEFIKREGVDIPQSDAQVIFKMAKLSGEAVDKELKVSKIQEERIKNHINSYLNMYLARPLSSYKFFKNIESGIK